MNLSFLPIFFVFFLFCYFLLFVSSSILFCCHSYTAIHNPCHSIHSTKRETWISGFYSSNLNWSQIIIIWFCFTLFVSPISYNSPQSNFGLFNSTTGGMGGEGFKVISIVLKYTGKVRKENGTPLWFIYQTCVNLKFCVTVLIRWVQARNGTVIVMIVSKLSPPPSSPTPHTNTQEMIIIKKVQ